MYERRWGVEGKGESGVDGLVVELVGFEDWDIVFGSVTGFESLEGL